MTTRTDKTTARNGVAHDHGLTAGDKQYATKADIAALQKQITDLTDRVLFLELIVCPPKKP